ncbi:glucan biosynthesis protein [Pseudoruegeria sp. HB172150]|uniref:glucan biosynthesis protein n=1 Tax=Pseudoruegeria sp. HB172150 TaxID=2721164 RepID=UPI00352E0DD1
MALPALTAPARLFAQDSETAAAPVEGEPFSFDVLTERMRAASKEPPAEPEQVDDFSADLHYDDYQRIRFQRDRMRWDDEEPSHFQVNAFHPGWLFKEPVHMHEVRNGQAVPMAFSTADFDYGDLGSKVPADYELPGVAGFRLLTQLNRPDKFDELVAFLGASYFRALGRDTAYGLSARGLAVNTGSSDGEEFPRFTDFWLERPAPGVNGVTLYAALRSASVTAAYRFVITPGDTTEMDVTARIFLRSDIDQLGIAPLTSMFLYGEADPGNFDDFRPAVHDSEALVMNIRSGETFFRPLANPARLASSYLWAENPLSFGLVQRDRDFDTYLDAQAHYERRPSLMVEPIGDWGRGTVRLMEIPSDLEVNDNVVAYWIPEAPTQAGGELEFRYRLHWGLTPPGEASSQRARVLRTRVGKGGVAGVEEETDRRKFVIDFQGGLLEELPGDAEVTPNVSMLRGEVAEVVLSRIDETGAWRLVIEASADSGTTAELKAGLTGYGRELTETWLYQWVKE